MENTLIQTLIRKKMMIAMAAILGGIALFYAAVCTPLSQIFGNNVLLRDTVLPMTVDFIMSILNYLYYWVAFAFLIYVGCTWGKRAYVSVFVIYGAVTLLRYVANLLAGFMVMSFPTAREFASEHLPYLIFEFCMDLLQMALVFLFVYLFVDMRRRTEKAFSKHLPIVSLTAFQNPIAKTALLCATVPASLQLIGRVIYDVNFGAPTSLVDLLWMIVSYLSDVLGFVAGYLVMLLLINQLYMMAKKIKLTFDTERSVME